MWSSKFLPSSTLQVGFGHPLVALAQQTWMLTQADTVTRVFSIADRKDTELGNHILITPAAPKIIPLFDLPPLQTYSGSPTHLSWGTWLLRTRPGSPTHKGDGQTDYFEPRLSCKSSSYKLWTLLVLQACLAKFEPCLSCKSLSCKLWTLLASLANSLFSQLLRSSAFAICRPFYRLIFTWS